MALEDEERRAWFRREVLPLEPQLLAYARSLLRRAGGDPEDLVHETFARLMGCATWREVQHPPSFATRTMKNLVLNEARRRAIVTFDVVADVDRLGFTDPAANPEEAAASRDELRRLIGLIQAMPTQMRRVFTLQRVYGLSQSEIAVRLGLSVSTVEKHAVRGLRFCSDRLAREAQTARKGGLGLWRTIANPDAKR
jgi:RNA polymerase sigma-70 factor (ECF subfamily)